MQGPEQQQRSAPKKSEQTPAPALPTTPSVPARPAETPRPGAEEKLDPGNVTLYRNNRFFVHAVVPDSHRHNVQQAGGNTSLLEQIRWISAEQLRVSKIKTRLLPRIELFNPAQKNAVPIPLWLEGVVVLVLLSLGLGAHAFNMFNYPQYGPDEGAYMANAWAIMHGHLQPYPYTYDHPPLGWIQLAVWTLLTGGFFSFETAINSGRVLMLLLAIASGLLVYLITCRLSGSRSAGLLAMTIYILSPLSVTYQREILLDNIGTFWLLLSVFFVVRGNSRLRNIIFSALALGIAILSKEVFLIFTPVMLYGVWLFATRFQRKFALVAFCYIVLSLSSAYALLAILKGELLPTGLLPGDTHAHPSLLGTLLQQVQYVPNMGDFATSWNTWIRLDQPLFIAGGIALVINIAGGWWNRLQWLMALFFISYWVLLLSIQNIFPYSILPLLPLLGMNIALALDIPLKALSKRTSFDLARALLLFLLLGALIPLNIQRANPQFSQNTAEPQRQALLWINRNAPTSSVIIINSYLYTDLHETGGMGVGRGLPYTQAQIYWNAAFDPEVHNTLLHDCWNRIDYLVVDTQMQSDIQTRGGPMLLLDRALHRSVLRAQFDTASGDAQSRIQVYQVLHDATSCN